MVDWELQLSDTIQHHEKVIVHITSLGKDPNSNFKVQFLMNANAFATVR
jgi:hypothetical protein